MIYNGLSPHIRGNQAGFPAVFTPQGSIPAHTGEPTYKCPHGAFRGVYPRTYGGTRRLQIVTG